MNAILTWNYYEAIMYTTSHTPDDVHTWIGYAGHFGLPGKSGSWMTTSLLNWPPHLAI